MHWTHSCSVTAQTRNTLEVGLEFGDFYQLQDCLSLIQPEDWGETPRPQYSPAQGLRKISHPPSTHFLSRRLFLLSVFYTQIFKQDRVFLRDMIPCSRAAANDYCWLMFWLIILCIQKLTFIQTHSLDFPKIYSGSFKQLFFFPAPNPKVTSHMRQRNTEFFEQCLNMLIIFLLNKSSFFFVFWKLSFFKTLKKTKKKLVSMLRG